MLNLQSIAIAVAAAFVFGLCGGSYFGWSLTSDYYSAKIIKTEAKAKDTLIVEQDKLIIQERKNNEITDKLNKLSLESSSKRDADAITIRSLLADKSKWLRNPTSCKDSAGASPATPSSATEQSPESYFSEEFQRQLDEIIREAVEASDYAEVAHEYALKIEEQRQRLSKENK